MSLPRLLTAALLLSGAASAEERPTLRPGLQGLTLAHLPAVLSEPTVARHLDTGLTTVFLLAVEARGEPKLAGAADLAVRYDLWDEVYAVGGRDAQGDRPATRLSSRAALLDWWRGLVLVVAPADPSPPLPREARVTLQVLPFSQAEQRDAQDWLLRSFRGPDRAPAVTPTADSRPLPREPVRDFYRAMLASSIGRRSLITYSWTVSVGDPR
jgi:hypothetical protein